MAAVEERQYPIRTCEEVYDGSVIAVRRCLVHWLVLEEFYLGDSVKYILVFAHFGLSKSILWTSESSPLREFLERHFNWLVGYFGCNSLPLIETVDKVEYADSAHLAQLVVLTPA